ncbi:MAG: hypothetical protein WD066_16465 [Planctomycetaceae bacterium]
MRCVSWKAAGCLLVGVMAVAGLARLGISDPPSSPAVEPRAEDAGDAVDAQAIDATRHWPVEKAAARDRAVREKLRTKIKAEYTDMPLENAIVDIAGKAGVAWWIDRAALEAEAIALDTPINRVLHAQADTVLDFVLAERELTWFVENELLHITTDIAAAARLVTRVYDVRRLIEAIREALEKDGAASSEYGDFEASFSGAGIFWSYRPWLTPQSSHGRAEAELLDVIENTTGGAWVGSDGVGGSITPHGHALVIRQSHRAHDEIAAFLEALTRSATEPRPRAYPVRPTGYPFADDDRVEKALDRRVPIKFADTPLEVAMQVLADVVDVPILLDRAGLDSENMPLDTPVNVVLEDVPLRTGLKLLLDQLGLTHVVKSGHVVVTTHIAAGEHFSVTVYDVRDLLIDGEFTSLIDVIENETSGPWFASDGIGGNPMLLPPGLLVIRQTESMHREIAELLSELRRVEAAQSKPAKPDPAEVVVRFHQAPANADPRELAATIKKFVDPESWKDGDESVIEIAGNVLVVRQQRKVQERIARFLFGLTVAAGTTVNAAVLNP